MQPIYNLGVKLNHAINCLTRRKPVEVQREQIDVTVINEALETIPNWDDGVNRQPLDATYYTTDPDSMREIVERDNTDLFVWQPGQFDCDDFAWRLRSVLVSGYGISAIGFVNDWSAEHAYNLVVYKDGTLEFIEPDPEFGGSDQWMQLDEFPRDDRHQLQRATIVI